MNDWLEWAIIAFIVCSIAYVAFRGGAANPESTGALGKAVATLSSDMGKMSSRMGRVEMDMEEVKRDGATTKDITQLEELLEQRIENVRAEVAGHKELAERTWKSVDRIERHLIERGLGGR